ncbi:MAG: LysR substrate-binding domain-containing protein [Bdellovibrio sp.]|jgi:LysR family transcriptional activator of nhaA
MIQLNYHHLYYFKVIATEGSISKAAQKLRLGQPTLSMQLKQFEDFLGHQLFERKNRSLVLTEMGRVVLSYANEIFHLGEEMLQTVADRPNKQKRLKLQIGALDSVPKALVHALMRSAYAKADCQISILEGDGPDLIKELIEHRLDLVLSNAAAPSLTEERLFTKSLVKMPLIVCGSRKFVNLRQNFPRSLVGQPFIVPTAHSRVRHELEHYFENHLIQIDVVAETQDTALMKTLAADGQGLIVIGEHAVDSALQDGAMFKIGELEGHIEEIWLIAAQRKIQNPIANEIMKNFSFDL